MSDYVLTVGDHDYEARKITLPRNRGVLIKFDFEDAPASALELPARGDEGIDVSRHQGNFDWKATKESGVKFAYIRATMGAPNGSYSGVDDRWRYNRAGARVADILDGVYHYVINGVAAQAQFDNLKREIGADFGALPIVVDVERRRDADGVPEMVNRTAFTASLFELLKLIEAEWKHKPLIYTSKLEWEAMTTLPEWESDYGFFVAQYAPTLTAVRAQWRVMVWQYSTTGNKLDRDRWLGGAANEGARHNFAPRLNQDVINLFAKVAGNNYIEWITRAELAPVLFGDRRAVYAGPDIEALPLTEQERQALIAVV